MSNHPCFFHIDRAYRFRHRGLLISIICPEQTSSSRLKIEKSRWRNHLLSITRAPVSRIIPQYRQNCLRHKSQIYFRVKILELSKFNKKKRKKKWSEFILPVVYDMEISRFRKKNFHMNCHLNYKLRYVKIVSTISLRHRKISLRKLVDCVMLSWLYSVQELLNKIHIFAYNNERCKGCCSPTVWHL